MNILFIFGVLVVAMISSQVIKQEKTVRIAAGVFAALTAVSIWSFVGGQFFGQTPIISSMIYLDKFSALIAGLIGLLYLSAAIVSVRYIGHEYHEGDVSLSDLRLYFTLLPLFILAMFLVTVSNNTIVMWLALEATTLSSTFLVGLYRKRTSLEAAWKYIIICSTGITLGLIGILLLGFGAHAGADQSVSFLLSDLLNHSGAMSQELVKWAFVFIFVGFGAKVGFVPTHTWLPDAHSKAPSPISALFSGILLNVALFAIVRFQMVANKSLEGSEWTSKFFLIFGILSVVLPAFMLLVQKNYKRMLAYSSIEHMGLISLGLALPPIGTIAAVMHMAGHAIVKSGLFFSAGEVLLRYKTTDTTKVRGMLKYAPYTSILFLLGIVAIVAMPPSVLFVSEYNLFVALISKHIYIALLAFASLGVIAFGMLRTTIGMILENKDDETAQKKEHWNVTHSIVTAHLVIVIILAAWFTSQGGSEFIANIVKNLS
jgi:hydrogenase-4 component F